VLRRRGSGSTAGAGDHTRARRGARRLWELLGREDVVQARGAVTGDRAVQVVEDGQRAIRLAAQAGLAHGRDAHGQDAFALMTAMIEAGAAGVHFEDRLPPAAGAGPRGDRVLVPTGAHIATLTAARFAADVLDVPALVIARTYAHETALLTSDADERDHEFLTGERTADGHHRVQPGLYARVTRALAFAPYADLLWLETSTPNLAEARTFADIIYSQYPDKLLAYSCAPAFDWAGLDDESIAWFGGELAAMGYRFQLRPNSARPRHSTRPQPSIVPVIEPAAVLVGAAAAAG
jgi:isocitrate lyase